VPILGELLSEVETTRRDTFGVDEPATHRPSICPEVSCLEGGKVAGMQGCRALLWDQHLMK
jgi:hypothetical protein